MAWLYAPVICCCISFLGFPHSQSHYVFVSVYPSTVAPLLLAILNCSPLVFLSVAAVDLNPLMFWNWYLKVSYESAYSIVSGCGPKRLLIILGCSRILLLQPVPVFLFSNSDIRCVRLRHSVLLAVKGCLVLYFHYHVVIVCFLYVIVCCWGSYFPRE
jgi:hypothetical protein